MSERVCVCVCVCVCVYCVCVCVCVCVCWGVGWKESSVFVVTTIAGQLLVALLVKN